MLAAGCLLATLGIGVLPESAQAQTEPVTQPCYRLLSSWGGQWAGWRQEGCYDSPESAVAAAEASGFWRTPSEEDRIVTEGGWAHYGQAWLTSRTPTPMIGLGQMRFNYSFYWAYMAAPCNGVIPASPGCGGMDDRHFRAYNVIIEGEWCAPAYMERPAPLTGCAPKKVIDLTQLPPKCNTCESFGNPIYPMTGAKKDFVPTGISMGGVELTLTYDSTPKAHPGGSVSILKDPVSFGALWRTNFHRKLLVVGVNKAALVSRGNGDVLYFEGGPSGFTAPANLAYQLVPISGGYVLRDLANGSLETFDSSGRLTTLSTGTGTVLTFYYGAGNLLTNVLANDGRMLRFAYSNGVIASVTAPDGSVIAATYDAQKNLSAVTWPDGKAFTFLYENAQFPWALTGKVDENNSRLATFAYDSGGRANSTEYAGATQRFAVSYAVPPERLESGWTYDSVDDVWILTRGWQVPTLTTLMRPDGQTSALEAQMVGGVPTITSIAQPAGSGSAPSSRSQTFDANGNVLSRDSYDGARTCFAYDASNRETSRVEGLATGADCPTVLAAGATLPSGARKITTAWHPDWNLPAAVTEPLKKTTIVYQGQPDPFNGNGAANCTSAALRADGKPVPVVCRRQEQALLAGGQADPGAPARNWQYSYDSAGRVTSSVDPNGKTTTFGLYGDTVFSGDAVDVNIQNVGLLLHANGAEGSTSFTDASWFPTTVTAAGNATISTAQSKFGGSSIAFDGNLDYLSIPDSSNFDFGTGAFTVEGWVYLTAADFGIIFEHANSPASGASGLFIQVNADRTISAGQAFCCALVGSGGNTVPVGAWTHLAVQRTAAGAWTIFINGSAAGTGSNAVNLDATGPVTLGGTARNAGDSMTGYLDEIRVTKGVARYAGSFTPQVAEYPNIRASFDATGHTFGDVQAATNPAGQVTTYNLYDPAGRVRKMTDPKGIVTEVTYTPRGWVSTVVVTPPGGAPRTTTYGYDFVGQMTSVSMPDGTSATYTYDAAHRLVGATDSRGNSVSYTLDNSGNRTAEEVRDPTGTLQRSIARSFDALNRVQQVTGAAR